MQETLLWFLTETWSWSIPRHHSSVVGLVREDLHAGGVGAHTELHFTLIFKKTKQIRNSKKRHNKEEGQEFSIEQFGR